MLEAEVQTQILALYFNEKKSIRKIALLIGVDRKTVRRIIERKKVHLEKVRTTRYTIIDDYQEQIKALLNKDPTMSAATVLNRIRDHGYIGGLSTVQKCVRKIRTRSSSKMREAFLRLDFAPGDCAQVDWGEFGDVFHNGVKIHCFVMVLCYSRLTYIEFTRSERFEDFIRCHENAFTYFGGVPKECWYDNLATAVQDRYGGMVKFNPRFFAYMGHHGISPHACNPARGNEKGRVESGVKFIRSHFWSGRVFKDFDDICLQSIL